MFKPRLLSVCIGAALTGLAPAVVNAAMIVRVDSTATAGALTDDQPQQLAPTGYLYSNSYASDVYDYASGLAAGNDAGWSRVRADGSGNYSANGTFHSTLEFTNNSGADAAYAFNFLLDAGSLSTYTATAIDAGESLVAGYSLDILLNGVSIFASSATLTTTDTGSSLARSGFFLNGADDGDDGYYGWNSYAGHLDLGVLGAGQSLVLDYILSGSVSGNVGTYSYDGGCGYDGYGYGDVLPQAGFYGGYGECNYTAAAGGSTARFGDPNGIEEFPFPANGGLVPQSVPEPGALALMGAGLFAAGLHRRRRRARAARRLD